MDSEGHSRPWFLFLSKILKYIVCQVLLYILRCVFHVIFLILTIWTWFPFRNILHQNDFFWVFYRFFYKTKFVFYTLSYPLLIFLKKSRFQYLSDIRKSPHLFWKVINIIMSCIEHDSVCIRNLCFMLRFKVPIFDLF